MLKWRHPKVLQLRYITGSDGCHVGWDTNVFTPPRLYLRCT